MRCKVKLTHVSSKTFLIHIGLVWLTIKEHIGEVDLVKLDLEVITQRYLYCQILQVVINQYRAALPICWRIMCTCFREHLLLQCFERRENPSIVVEGFTRKVGKASMSTPYFVM